MGAISTLLGHIIKFIYDIVQNYGWAIILFTLLVRIILLPLNIKQQKSMMRMQKISPVLTEIQEKYKNDKEKLNKETMKIYQDYKISPLAGCLPMLIQLPILFALIRVIYDPGLYMFGLQNTAEALNLYPQARNITDAKLIMAVKECGLNSMFFGIDLTSIPNWRYFNTLWVFPILSTVATFFSGKVTQAMSGNAGNEQQQQQTKMMNSIFPLMTAFFTFTMPVAASLYWTISSAIQVLQTYLLKKIIKVNITIDDGGSWHERNNKKRQNS